MADRNVALTTIKGGINRQRTKGGALEDSLYDLLNGYVTKSKTVVVRPGDFRHYVLPEGTKGLVAFDGVFHVFASEQVTAPPGIEVHILTHEDATAETPIAISEINFAVPFMGYLYVIATFENGDCQHFWVQGGDEWAASTTYKLGDIVEPSVPNGLAFQAQRLTQPNTSWAPNVLRTLGDVIEPTVYNDYTYTVVDTQGANPRSGTVEPTWPTEDGARVFEDADGSSDTPPSVTEMPDTSAVPSPGVVDRYRNLFRNRGG